MDLAKTKQCRSRVVRWGSLGLLLLLGAGCIRPVEETPTSPSPAPGSTINVVSVPTPTFDPFVTPVAPVTPTIAVSTSLAGLTATDLTAIENYISIQLNQPIQTGTLTTWWQQPSPVPQEEIVAFSFRNPSGINCIGVVFGNRTSANVLNVFTGGATCATELGATALASSWLLAGQNQPIPIVATIGELFNAGGAVAGATVIFPNSVDVQILSQSIATDRFLHIQANIVQTASEVVFFNQDGIEIRRQRVIQ